MCSVMSFGDSCLRFGWDLFKLLSKDDDSNVFFSPLSIAAALAMTMAGARNKTVQEMTKSMHLITLIKPEHKLVAGHSEELHTFLGQCIKALHEDKASDKGAFVIANRVYTESTYKLAQEFVGLLKKAYDGQIVGVDFKQHAKEVTTEINNWVSQTTNKKIENLIPDGALTALTRLVLVNAVYFKGSWSNPFEKSLTTPGKFRPSAKAAQIDVQMMHIKKSFHYTSNEHEENPKLPKYQAVALPFVKTDDSKAGLHMVIILPEDMQKFNDAIHKKKCAVAESSDWVQEILTTLLKHSSSMEIFLNLPRFKLSTDSCSIKSHLISLGMGDLFDDRKADLSGITGVKNDLYVDDVVHKAVIEVNEEGAEAAAATAVIMCCMSAPMWDPPVVTVDRPCYLMIVDDAQLCPIFMGRVNKPDFD